jgi:hypothetical protein
MQFALTIVVALLCTGLGASTWIGVAIADVPDSSWKMASKRSYDGAELSLYVEAEKKPGQPAFRIETSLAVSPLVAAVTLMEEMSEPGGSDTGQTRRLLERTDRDALVHTYIDLPFMFSDRELAVRIRHTDDRVTGIHRIDWVDENAALPPAGAGVLRLATEGYWEFRPSGLGRTDATYVSRAEVGGSLPSMISNRLMKKQAVESVERLHGLLSKRRRTHVAGSPASSTSAQVE